jgi:hypothetical protein
MLVPGKTFQSSLMFVGLARSLPKKEHLKVASFGLTLALLVRMILDPKDLPETNTLAYYKYT